MEPKEKAQKLVNRFLIKVHDREGTSAMNEFEAKQCALIAVDEILYALTFIQEEIDGLEDFYKEVKQEIEKK